MTAWLTGLNPGESTENTRLLHDVCLGACHDVCQACCLLQYLNAEAHNAFLQRSTTEISAAQGVCLAYIDIQNANCKAQLGGDAWDRSLTALSNAWEHFFGIVKDRM